MKITALNLSFIVKFLLLHITPCNLKKLKYFDLRFISYQLQITHMLIHMIPKV
jgi:hypothetical protein